MDGNPSDLTGLRTSGNHINNLRQSMAVWQYKGEFIPESWLIARYGRIPEMLEDYLMTEDTDLDAIEDPQYWKDINVPDDLVQVVESILPEAQSWSDKARMFGNDRTNEIEVWYADGKVDCISFSWDVSHSDLEVLNQIVSLARRLGASIVTNQARVINADMETVLKDVMQSNAYRFCKDPRAFLSELSRKGGRGGKPGAANQT